MVRVFRWLARGLIAVFALLTLVACALHVTQTEGNVSVAPPEAAALRIASYNVHYIWLDRETGPWSVGDWERRKGPLDSAFKALRADVVAFQEMESFRRGDDGSVNLVRDHLTAGNPAYGVAATGDWQTFPTTQPILSGMVFLFRDARCDLLAHLQRIVPGLCVMGAVRRS
jgi:hypothetical protein